MGSDNCEDCVKNLTSLGYKHFGFNLMQDTLQPRWMHVIEINGRSEEEVQKDMESKTRQILRKNEKSSIKTHEITKEELPIFKEIMEHTSDRRDFVDRPLSYYEAMWDNLHDSGILKILIAEILDGKIEELYKAFENLQQEIPKQKEEYIEENNNEEELEIIRQLCKKIMNIHKSNEEKIEELENESIEDKKENISQFKKINKEIKRLIDEFNSSLQEMHDTISNSQKEHENVLQENIKQL